MAMAICPIIVHFSTWRAPSMHDVACEFARAIVRSKDAQKQLARTSLSVEFYPKAVFFERKFKISWSAIAHVQN